jgi:hypothetical protein
MFLSSRLHWNAFPVPLWCFLGYDKKNTSFPTWQRCTRNASCRATNIALHNNVIETPQHCPRKDTPFPNVSKTYQGCFMQGSKDTLPSATSPKCPQLASEERQRDNNSFVMLHARLRICQARRSCSSVTKLCQRRLLLRTERTRPWPRPTLLRECATDVTRLSFRNRLCSSHESEHYVISMLLAKTRGRSLFARLQTPLRFETAALINLINRTNCMLHVCMHVYCYQ